jgi:hypothetical protein
MEVMKAGITGPRILQTLPTSGKLLQGVFLQRNSDAEA